MPRKTKSSSPLPADIEKEEAKQEMLNRKISFLEEELRRKEQRIEALIDENKILFKTALKAKGKTLKTLQDKKEKE